ncbi:MAG: Ppx/GppA phosphatase family protein [Micrococcaceae bacterium]
MTRVAAIDCGTNSIRLLIADADEQNHQLEPLYGDNIIVRLGQGVDQTGRLADEAIERTFTALDKYAAMIKKYDVDKTRFVATSATRDAKNRKVFFDGVQERLGIEPEVISGDEEAQLSFDGALLGLDSALKGPFLLSDLGGGSTELVLGDRSGVAAEYSMDVGCVRVTERCLQSDPATDEEIEHGQEMVDAALQEAEVTVDLSQANAYIGVAGTTTTVATHALNLSTYDPEKIHGAHIPFTDMKASCDEILAMSKAERAEQSYILPGRIDVIGGGCLVLKRVMERIEEATNGRVNSIIVSETDILHGIALSCVLD